MCVLEVRSPRPLAAVDFPRVRHPATPTGVPGWRSFFQGLRRSTKRTPDADPSDFQRDDEAFSKAPVSSRARQACALASVVSGRRVREHAAERQRRRGNLAPEASPLRRFIRTVGRTAVKGRVWTEWCAPFLLS